MCIRDRADKYIAQVFNFPQTRVIESSKIYRRGGESPRIELLLVGEPLGEDVIENARGQLSSYGLPRTESVGYTHLDVYKRQPTVRVITTSRRTDRR